MAVQPRIALLSSLTPEITAEIIRVKARDRIAPGWGINQHVVSFVAHSRRIVVVEDVYYTLDLSVTVHDFLLEFLKQKLGPVWGTAELAKLPDKRVNGFAKTFTAGPLSFQPLFARQRIDRHLARIADPKWLKHLASASV